MSCAVRASFHRSSRLVLTCILTALLFLALVQISGGPVFAQGSTGSINGTVTDPTGAAVPGASVTLKNADTGTEQPAVTNNDGRYVFATVQPGKYTISISKAGFSTTNEQEFQLSVNQTATQDFKLQLGSTKSASHGRSVGCDRRSFHC
jgi:hypothetical protein